MKIIVYIIMFTFLSYLCTPILLMGAGFSAYYMYDRRSAQAFLFNTVWTATRGYVQLVDYVHALQEMAAPVKAKVADKQKEDKEEKEPESPSCRRTMLYYMAGEKATYSAELENYESIEAHTSEEPLIMFLVTEYSHNRYYKRTDDPRITDTEYLTLDERPFIQVEFIEEGKKAIDIHSSLSGFYIEENTILDHDFLKWYMGYFYDIHSFGAYKLKIIDKNVNMFTLTDTDKVVLENNGYKIEKNASSDVEECDTSGSDGPELI